MRKKALYYFFRFLPLVERPVTGAGSPNIDQNLEMAALKELEWKGVKWQIGQSSNYKLLLI